MDYLDFRKDYLENVKAVAAAENLGTQESFVTVSCDHLVGGEIFDDFNLSYSSGKTGRHQFKVDAYTYDEYDNSVSLIIADFNGGDDITTLTQTDAETLFNRVRVVVKESISGKLRNIVEISTPAYDLVDIIYAKRNELRKIKFFIITDKEMSKRIGSFDQEEIGNIPCEYHVWDIVRFHRLLQTGDGHEPMEIDLTMFSTNGLPCLPAHSVSSRHVTCYLSVLPGVLLADIYDAFGSRLLEGNVRTFLSARGNVNKGIRRTILSDEKDLFFAYNNGIAATASEVETISIEGQLYLKSIKNFQIVNGGQTTASLSNTRYKDKASLDNIFVQMKLTVVEDVALAGEIIPNISRYANSQNKVSDADFFSNHEFNIRMQQISRRVWAPAVLGAQNETHWFYERARGQYETEQAKMTPSQKKAYAQINPKSQRFDKTMLAKLENSWRGYPHIASAGAQKSFKRWAETIVSEWEKDNSGFNEPYFKNLVAVLIIFRFLEKNIPKQVWYESGYRANIVVYTISYFNHLVSVQYPDKVLDRNTIWLRQALTDRLEIQLIEIAEFIFRYITDENRPIMNVTEWCKREECWDGCKKRRFQLHPDIENNLAYIDNIKDEERAGRKQRKMQSAMEQTINVVNKGADFWKKVSFFMLERKLLSDKEMSILSVAVQMDRGKPPTDKQSAVIMDILDKARDEGFSE